LNVRTIGENWKTEGADFRVERQGMADRGSKGAESRLARSSYGIFVGLGASLEVASARGALKGGGLHKRIHVAMGKNHLRTESPGKRRENPKIIQRKWTSRNWSWREPPLVVVKKGIAERGGECFDIARFPCLISIWRLGKGSEERLGGARAVKELGGELIISQVRWLNAFNANKKDEKHHNGSGRPGKGPQIDTYWEVLNSFLTWKGSPSLWLHLYRGKRHLYVPRPGHRARGECGVERACRIVCTGGFHL